MKLNQLKVRIIEEADAATLEASVNTFLAGIGEATLVGEVRIVVYNTQYVALIQYTE